ncbi:MAG: glycerol-3-phosphate dehydrogenase [Clostridia bacterium]|nr:glycerol-3-phosphate dehydrogenase [Clostridia bacterium]MDE6677295.1 glycerol-3-phosphate dehydrogenase [Clostridia bacterium]
MKISVLGCGRWGSFIAWYLSGIGHEVYSWGPEDDYSYQILKKTGRNEYVALDKKITLTCNLQEAVEHAEAIVISISAQGLRGFMQRVTAYDIAEKNFILCMKGIEVDTGKRLSEVLTESGISSDNIAVWVGPGHIQSFVKGEPNCMVIDSANEKLKHKLVHQFKSKLIRFYYGNDLIGTEIGAAAKNVMGIAAGALDVICPPLKGPLMTRGAREVANLIKAMGGNELSAYGLAHLGDYETTLFSPYSHNRQYGESLAKGQRFEKLAEGVATSKAIRFLGKKYDVELPITDSVYRVCFGWGDDEKRCRDEIGKLFARRLKAEWE